MRPNTNSSSLLHLENNNSQRSSTKSSPSMIFRIEHLLPNAGNRSVSIDPKYQGFVKGADSTFVTNVEKQSKFLHTGIYAAQFTPKDTTSQLLDTLSVMNVIIRKNTEDRRCYCILSKDKELVISPNQMRQIKLSEDIHSSNSVFELCAGKLRLRTVKDITHDEELVAWFNDEISLLMSMPFLTPLNIQSKLFENVSSAIS